MDETPTPKLLHRKAQELLFRIRREAERAMLLSSIWWRANTADITSALNETTEAIAFNAIRDAVHMAIVQGLMRVHDRDHRAIGLGHIFAVLQDDGVREWLRMQNWSRNIDVDAEINAARDLFSSETHQGHMTALKALRDQHIAHHDLSPADHGAKYGFERKLLTSTLRIINHLDLALNGTGSEFEAISGDYDQCSEDFWTRVARGQPARDNSRLMLGE